MWAFLLKNALPIASFVTIGTLIGITFGGKTPNWVYGTLVAATIGLLLYLAPELKETIKGHNPIVQKRALDEAKHEAETRNREIRDAEARAAVERKTREAEIRAAAERRIRDQQELKEKEAAEARKREAREAEARTAAEQKADKKNSGGGGFLGGIFEGKVKQIRRRDGPEKKDDPTPEPKQQNQSESECAFPLVRNRYGCAMPSSMRK